jgi:hypothetical protein
MNQCGKLFRADAVYAFFDSTAKRVVVAADVWMNPFTDEVHVCPNPLAMPVGAREFIVEGVSRHAGIHPMLMVKNRVSTSFPSDATPASVVVYTQGVDAPARQEVQVASAPPPALQPAAQAAEQPAQARPAEAKAAKTEVTGHSATFSFDEAVHDALTQAAALYPSPPRNPDVAVTIEVTKITARSGGNILPGLYLTAIAKP